jgi:hypothetical protein
MPKYTINGVTFNSDRELSATELEELAAQVSTRPGQIPTGGQPQAPAAVPTLSASERMLQNAIAGAAIVPPLAAGARVLSAAFQGSRAAPYVANLAQALVPQSGRALAAEGAIGAAGGVVGGELGEQVARKAGEEYRTLGEFGGGLVGGLAANTLLRNIPQAVMAGTGLGRGREATEQVADLIGGARARTRLSQAMEANPALTANLAESQRIEKELGVRLPVTAASKGDTTLEGMAQSVTSRGENAAFTALLKSQEEEAVKALAEARRKMSVSKGDVEAMAELQAARVRAENARRERVFAEQQLARQSQIDKIDERISDLTYNTLATADGVEQIGTRVTNLLAAKERAVKDEFKPKYDELLSNAKKADVVMPSEGVALLHRFVKESRGEDVFAKFPQLYAQINRVLAPQKAPVSSKFAEKYPNLVRSVEGTYKPASVEDIDSLKRAINRAIGSSSDPDQLRLLSELRRNFDNALGTVDQDFVTQYKALDKQYAERVGMPFSEQGVVSVNRAKFVENTVPYLTNKPSAIRDILAASDNSPEALKIVEDAFLFKIANTASIVAPDGSLNPLQLQRFIRKHKEAIDQVPGLQQRLSGLASDVSVLKDTRARILEEKKNASVQLLESVWDKSRGTSGGFYGVVQSALTRPDDLKALMNTAATDPALGTGLRAAVLDIGLSRPDRVGFYTDNKQTIDSLFGSGHSERVRLLFEAGDRLDKFPVRAKINPSLTQKTAFEAATGSRPEQVAGDIRNQILSGFRVFANFMSRFGQNRATKAEEAEIKEFLANPKAVEDASALLAELEKQGNTLSDKAKDLFKRLVKNTASAGMFGGLAGVGAGAVTQGANE